jgi:rSAM/selenodomain-associated transferase 1
VAIVFMRAPQLGAVKKRLAAGIGSAAAHRFYVTTTRTLLRRIGADARWDVHLAVTPDGAAENGRHWSPRYRRFAQGGGDLGARMARAMQRFPHRPVVLVGSDIPDLSAHHIADAFAALGRNDLVFGPATDGGYWLVGARVGAMARGLFKDVRWSGPDALADTLANATGRRVALLDELNDVDDAADYARWRGVSQTRR